MIDGLVAGTLYGKPEQRTGKSGKPVTVAKARAAACGEQRQRAQEPGDFGPGLTRGCTGEKP